MYGSRRILLVLLLASVTCVVVVQITLDGWNLRGTFPYGENAGKTEHSDLAVEQVESTNLSKVVFTTVSVIKKTSTISTTSNAPKLTSSLQKRASVSSNDSTVSKQPKQTKTVVKIRRLPLGTYSQTKLLVNRQDRIQEILKQSSIVQGRASTDPMRSLRSMPIVNPQNVTRILVVTYFRAGSSFFGDLLQQNWKTFYQFEPLHSMTYDSRIDDSKLPEAFKLFDGIFRCNFTDLKNYLHWVKQPRNQFLFAHNLFLWATCHSNPNTCFNPAFINAVCQRAPIQVMKVTRLHMHQLKNFFLENPGLKIKVVYLTRDPRGIVSSRWALDWCNGTQCSDPKVLCHEMSEDIQIFQELQNKDPSYFIHVRYEDLSLNPEAESRRLFQFLKLPFSQSVQRFLKTHTVGRGTDKNNPYSTRRNTTAMAFSWRERFTFDQVKSVQATCGQVLHNLNHSLITSPSQLPFPNGTQVKKHSLNNNQKQSKSKKLLPSVKNTHKSLIDFIPKSQNFSVISNNISEIFTINSKNKTSAVSLAKNYTLEPASNLNNTRIEIHKGYYKLQSSSPKHGPMKQYFQKKSTLGKR